MHRGPHLHPRREGPSLFSTLKSPTGHIPCMSFLIFIASLCWTWLISSSRRGSLSGRNPFPTPHTSMQLPDSRQDRRMDREGGMEGRLKTQNGRLKWCLKEVSFIRQMLIGVCANFEGYRDSAMGSLAGWAWGPNKEADIFIVIGQEGSLQHRYCGEGGMCLLINRPGELPKGYSVPLPCPVSLPAVSVIQSTTV